MTGGPHSPPWANVIVAVDAADLQQPFTYRVPENLDSPTPVSTGDRVVVPFGNRPVLGIVVDRSHSLPETLAPEKVKEVAGRLQGAESRVPEDLIRIARTLADDHLCALSSAIRCVFPESHNARLERRWVASSAPPGIPVPASVAELHHRLREAGQDGTLETSLVREFGDTVQRQLQSLRKQGLAIPTWKLIGPKIRARRIRRATLAFPWDQAQRESESRSKGSPAQARLLQHLVEAGGSNTVSELLRLAGTTSGPLQRLVDEGWVRVDEVDERRRPHGKAKPPAPEATPTAEQEAAIHQIQAPLHTRQHKVHLLFGVTGSGKTEVYLRLIQQCRRLGRGALVLVPEIALTAQVVDLFRSRLGDRVAVLHSGLSPGEKRDEWFRIESGDADVVVGARSAVFAPLANVGIVIVDEEHEASYKQDSPAPRYHARDVAIERARENCAVVVLGSATPSVESFHKARTGSYELIFLTRRALDRPMPTVEIVDLRKVWKESGPCLFSPALAEAIGATLDAGGQSILFLNRRGFAMFLLCRDCGFSTRCPHCEVSLTYHRNIMGLACHHCGYEAAAPDCCPSCGGDRLRPFGIGTERVEEELAQMFPSARVLRMDRDTTARKDAHLTMVRAFRDREADILVGTQMVAKGLDFPGVTLVGVVSADTALNIPDFRASERAFQLLTQVSGRAGRGETPGRVLIQTFNPAHESVVAAATQDYEAFFDKEIVYREELNYPPFRHLSNIIASDADAASADAKLRSFLAHWSAPVDVDVLGPAACPLSRLRGKHRWHILLKGRAPSSLRSAVAEAFGRIPSADRTGMIVDFEPMTLL